MRRLAAVALMLCALSPIAARAQEPATARDRAALQQLVEEQLRRIEALEAQLAQLRQEIEAIVGQPLPGTVDDTKPLEEPFEHAVEGAPPIDPDAEAPAADLPRALNVDFYGSLRVLYAADTGGFWEVRNNFSRVGIRGEKQLFGPIVAFARWELGINMVASDRAILLISADPGSPIG